ncbi:MAG: ABC transporter substrate-binding protein [Candidatus Pristimantibacillus lignocellulolyticus]|uniref:ABC transporter substrate-binding protein n=1 Tax=Candidatus Pristimantibacillus lignocellulolyticus TaxID=2994561 RepID=A0A9J6ZK37_9BACL|nr:MAG: ABC transporter substrate-binding protein [Candidatus Pristimantibacillus lignocellulolyticus]
MKKKLLLGFVLATIMLVIAACGNNDTSNSNTSGSTSTNNSSSNTNNTETTIDGDDKQYKVAISQFVEHASLDAVRDGIIAALKDGGIEEGKNLTIDYQNTQADFNNLTAVSQKIKSGKPDVAVGIATPNAISLVDEITDIPVVFAAVTDPIDAKLVPTLEASGGNVTGASDSNPDAIEPLMDFIAKEFPNVKKVGIVINKSEPNAVVMAETAKNRLATHNIGWEEAPIVNGSDVQQAAQSLVGRVDAIYITLDNTVVESVDAIIDVAYEHDIPFFSADRDTVEKGAFATLGFRYYDHGYEVGQMLLEILKDGKKPGDMNVRKPEQLDFILNMKAAQEMGITVTDAMKDYVKDPAQNILE